MRKLLGLLLALALVTPGFGSTISGSLRAPNGSPVRNGTLTLALSQSGIVVGSFALVPSPVTCATDSVGSLVGVPNPAVAPSASAQASGGTVPAATYYVRITYITADATESEASPARLVLASSTGKINVTGPTVQPSSASGYNIYVGTASSVVHLQTSVTGFANTSVTAYDSGGAAPPSSNSTLCDVAFNDTIIPSFTWYRVGLTLAPAGVIATGFPQNWYLAGSSVDVSTHYPLAAGSMQTRFPTPLLANPSSNAQQSVNSPVTLNGYSLTAGSIRLPANSDPPACTGTESLIYTDSLGNLKLCQNGSTTFGYTDWYDTDTASVIGNQFLARSRGRSDPASGIYTSLMYDSGENAGVLAARNYTTSMDEDFQFQGLSHKFIDNLVTTLTIDSAGSVFSAPAFFTDSTEVTGALSIQGGVSIGSGAMTVASAATFTGTLLASGVTTVSGAINVSGALATTGTVSFSTGVVTINSDSIVNGQLIMANRIVGSGGTTPLASTDNLAMSSEGNYAFITGTNAIKCLSTTGWQQGAEAVLLFNDASQVQDSQICVAPYARFRLNGSMNFTPAQGSTLSLLYNGADWYELARTNL